MKTQILNTMPGKSLFVKSLFAAACVVVIIGVITFAIQYVGYVINYSHLIDWKH